MKEKGTRRQFQKMQQFHLVDRRFGWMSAYLNEPCENPTTPLFNTEKWSAPMFETNNICANLVSLMNSTMSFYDHVVCLDKINFKLHRSRKRRYENIKSDFIRSKKVFNRLLRGLKCSERLSLN